MRLIPLARLAVWALCLGAAVLIALILGGSEDVQGKVAEATILFVLFSLNALSGVLLIERRPEQAPLGAATIGLSLATYIVVLDYLFSDGLFSTQNSVWLLVAVALVVGQASMLLAFKRDDDSPLVSAALTGALLVLAALAILAGVEAASPGADIGDTVYATLAVLYLLGALLPPCLRWADAEETY